MVSSARARWLWQLCAEPQLLCPVLRGLGCWGRGDSILQPPPALPSGDGSKVAPGSTRPCGCRRASPPSRSPETEPGTRLSPQVLPRSSRRATLGCEPPAPEREEVVGGGWKELRKRVSGELPTCTSDSASPRWVGDGRPLPAEGPAHRTSGPVLGCAEPLKDLVGKRFLMRLGLCRGGWTGNEGLHACGALNGPVSTAAARGRRGRGAQEPVLAFQSLGAWWGPLCAGLACLGLWLPWSLALLVACCGAVSACRAGPGTGLGTLGGRDPEMHRPRVRPWGPGLSMGGRPFSGPPMSVLTAPGSQLRPPRPRKDPKPLLPSSKCLWIMYIQMSSCQLHGENTLFELDGI